MASAGCSIVSGHLFEGAAAYQIEGEPAQILPAGSAFYEPASAVIAHFAMPRAPHRWSLWPLLSGEEEESISHAGQAWPAIRKALTQYWRIDRTRATVPAMARPTALVIALLCFALPALAQTSKSTTPTSIAAHPDWPKAKAADVQSVDAIIAALYDVISGPAGQPRDWNRFRSLFIPDARLIPTRHSKTGTSADVQPLTVEQFQQLAAPSFDKGFFERGIHETTESFGDVVHVFSSYESRRTKDAPPFQRGINSIQLLKDGDRYWVVTIYWDQETPTNPIPAKYLP